MTMEDLEVYSVVADCDFLVLELKLVDDLNTKKKVCTRNVRAIFSPGYHSNPN